MGIEDLFTLKSGRRLAVHTLAEGVSGRTVVLCHAAPGSGLFDPDPEATWARGVALISVDRPGYGGSDPVGPGEWSSVERAADELAEVLVQLGTGPVGVAGWSAGGRVALALAARHPDLVERVAVVATPAPHEEVPWIPPEQNAGLEALRSMPPDQVHAALTQQLAPLATDPAHAVALLGAGPADQAALAAPGARDRLEAMLRNAFVQGAAGLAADIAGYCLAPWGFEPEQVEAKTLLVYGAADPVAGPRHGKWYQRRVPDARFEQSPGSGHLDIIPRWQRVLSHLAPHSKR
ncbi:alpha/beta hydrolase [Rhizocola hellebori]|uniref:Alpha/beta hydrolase n=1 Tax=Rhizocola hellebori TaxID=1392758 RepID=A0A8J3Q627_9ACTN|nr:alpha/beta hydrolase [Rhizocola hellebori]GIH04713.1 alpha/beta hydrolase [Rhizocola hellebori]